MSRQVIFYKESKGSTLTFQEWAGSSTFPNHRLDEEEYSHHRQTCQWEQRTTTTVLIKTWQWFHRAREHRELPLTPLSSRFGKSMGIGGLEDWVLMVLSHDFCRWQNGASLSGSLSTTKSKKVSILLLNNVFSHPLLTFHYCVIYGMILQDTLEILHVAKLKTCTSSWLAANRVSEHGLPHLSLIWIRQFTSNLVKLS